jgi:hypothetical protein
MGNPGKEEEGGDGGLVEGSRDPKDPKCGGGLGKELLPLNFKFWDYKKKGV